MAWFSLSEPPELEQELIDLYLDRDTAAANVHFSEMLGRPFPVHRMEITHDGNGQQQRYCDHFNCEVIFSSPCARIFFPSTILDEALPHSDPESNRHFQLQCQLLIAKLTNQSHFIDDVRMLMLARPGFFPDLDYLAEKLEMSTRTLRRRLKEEGSSYRELLDEVRFRLAREYLGLVRLATPGATGYT